MSSGRRAEHTSVVLHGHHGSARIEQTKVDEGGSVAQPQDDLKKLSATSAKLVGAIRTHLADPAGAGLISGLTPLQSYFGLISARYLSQLLPVIHDLPREFTTEAHTVLEDLEQVLLGQPPASW